MISEFSFKGKDVRFFVEDPNDLIQKQHLNHFFYEPEELEILSTHYKRGVFVDIGANVGNHTVFASRVLGAKKIFCFEANEKAYKILQRNIALNHLGDIVDQQFLGLVVADKPDEAYQIKWREGNLGGGKASKSDHANSIRSITGDIALSCSSVDYIKIDVEGGELQVLAGLASTINYHKPRIFIEVFDKNFNLFEKWLAVNSYKIDHEYRRYKVNSNFFISHRADHLQ